MFTENQLIIIILSHSVASVACWCCSVDRINVTYTEIDTTQTNMSHLDMSHDGDMALVYCWPSQPLRLLTVVEVNQHYINSNAMAMAIGLT